MNDDTTAPGPIQAPRQILNDPSGIVITRGGVALTLAQIEALALFFERATGGLNAANLSAREIDEASAPPLIQVGIGAQGLAEIGEEYLRTIGKFPRPLASAHEGYAVLRDGVDKLWDHIKAGKPAADQHKAAVQVAAMALRFIIDSVAREGKCA
jgi:hypothetical protein